MRTRLLFVEFTFGGIFTTRIRMSTQLKFIICPDPNNPTQECRAAKIIERLHSQGLLKSHDPNGTGNCHPVTVGILTDIAEAGFDTNGWFYVQGECKLPQGLHSWLEFEGWVVDFSSGQQVFTPVSEFTKVKEPENLIRLTLKQLTEKLNSPKGRSELGFFEWL